MGAIHEDREGVACRRCCSRPAIALAFEVHVAREGLLMELRAHYDVRPYLERRKVTPDGRQISEGEGTREETGASGEEGQEV